MLKVTGFPVGGLQSNCFILSDTESHDAVIIDPGDEGEKIVQMVKNLKVVPKLIINTHGHGDHIGANGYVKDAFSIPIAIHKDDAPMLTDADLNLSSMLGLNILSPPADQLLEDGREIDFAGRKIKVYHTPGHLPVDVLCMWKICFFPVMRSLKCPSGEPISPVRPMSV